MSLVNGAQGAFNSAANFVRNPLDRNVTPTMDGPDFKDGFIIEEILSNGKVGEKVTLVGNMMPKDKVSFGGTQRVKKEYYSGYSEPSVQVFGPEESDMVINGEFKDKRYTNTALKGVALEISQLIDAIRIRGNIVRIRLGEMERYAIIKLTKFDLERITKIPYSITFDVIGFNAPKNAVFLQRNKEYPFAINKALIDEATEFQKTYSSIPASVPMSIADAINNIISGVASVMASVYNFIDSAFKAVDDIKNAVNRAKGLIKYAQNKLRQYKNAIGGFSPFSAGGVTDRYNNAGFYSSAISGLARMASILAKLNLQFGELSLNFPLARHLVIEQDTLQKISVKFYGNQGNWKNIYDYNELNTTDLVSGSVLNIPRIS